jgi:hypothetical protein
MGGVMKATSAAPFHAHELPDLSVLGGPRFVITVDTEEEFEWGTPFTRDRHSTNHVAAIPRFQRLCQEYGVIPCYLVDYPIVDDDKAVDLLAGYAHIGQAEIGAQLHPWVNPPFAEELSVRNSFACNLPAALEREKLTRLYTAIVDRMAVQPDVYRAGRYGAGTETSLILADLGIAIDTSARARFDYSAQGGPDYSQYPVDPFWLIKGKLLELPLTTIFSGTLRGAGDAIFSRWFASDAARSMLARSNMLERLALTPEGIPAEKAVEAIDIALGDAVPILNLSFHSPSLAPGHTPYVRDETELEMFYRWWQVVLGHLAARGVRATTMAEIKVAAHLKR